MQQLYGVNIYPSEGIKNGYKFSEHGAIFISSDNFQVIKDTNVKGFMVGIKFLQEINQ